MSRLPDAEPECRQQAGRSIETVIVPKARDIGDFEVRRVLPARERRAVGPFVFFDHMGPAEFGPGDGLAVRPHPHIGLATLTYLYEGKIVHRDSLGFKQVIEPGAVNWMSAGRGIVHSERSPESHWDRPDRLMGLQVWVALPKEQENSAPQFVHFSACSLPELETGGVRIRVVAGECFGEHSRLPTQSPLFFVDMRFAPGAQTPLQADYTERAFYVVEGQISVDGQTFGEGQMAVLKPGGQPVLESGPGAMVVAVGGEPLDGPRHVWWNFVASDRERIERAKADWREDRFGHVPGDDDPMPLPPG